MVEVCYELFECEERNQNPFNLLLSSKVGIKFLALCRHSRKSNEWIFHSHIIQPYFLQLLRIANTFTLHALHFFQGGKDVLMG